MSDSTDKKFKNCPFCGMEPEILQIGNSSTKTRKIVVRCAECRVEMTLGAIRESHEWLLDISLERWNRRIR